MRTIKRNWFLSNEDGKEDVGPKQSPGERKDKTGGNQNRDKKVRAYKKCFKGGNQSLRGQLEKD